jgi:CheY-like chemotaxis protein
MSAIFFLVMAVAVGLGLYYLIMLSVFILPIVFLGGLFGGTFYLVQQWFKNRRDTRVGAPRVLIVEDDVDMANVAELAFKSLGASTTVVTDAQQATKLLSENGVDIVILDWLLQNDIKASRVLQDAVKKRTLANLPGHANYPNVITFSGLSPDLIDFPQTEGFHHVEHWQKPIPYSEFKNRSSQLLTAVGF